MSLFRISALFLCLSLFTFEARAWGVVGHRAIARVAENHLTPKAKREIAALLGAEILPLVSTYPDEIRPYPEYKYTSPWHYINTAPDLDKAQYTAAIAAMTEPNAYLALQQLMQQVKDPTKSKEERAFALKFIVHIVGDVHQPLHACASGTQGGNSVAVKFQGKDLNLHSLWDSALIEYEGLTYLELAQACDHASHEQVRQWQADSPAVWLFESYQLSAPLLTGATQNPVLDFRYYPAHAAVLQQRLLQAGIRLAGVLNQLFA